jgi:hypothetical protein
MDYRSTIRKYFYRRKDAEEAEDAERRAQSAESAEANA